MSENKDAKNKKKLSKKTKMWIIGGGAVLLVALIAAVVVFFVKYPGGIPQLINEIEMGEQPQQDLEEMADLQCRTQGYDSFSGWPSDTLKINEMYCEKDGVKYKVFFSMPAYKPMIYLYPEKTTEVSVRLGDPEKLTSVYPKYNDGWKVTAKPGGTLVGMDGREYYGLYWEGKGSYKETDEGFVVKGDEVAEFLEEKLAILGLNEREAEEFIVYWLPKMNKNEYNYVRFATTAEIEKDMPLEVTPKPDTTIRIMMVAKKLEAPKTLKEQKLSPVERKGFTVIEWGGTDLGL